MRLFQIILLFMCFTWSSSIYAAEGPQITTTIPIEKDRERHDQFLAVAKEGGIDVLFLGDSITDGWRNTGKSVWDHFFAPLKSANFGIGGDSTQHVIWRLRNGELEGIRPKVTVIMIGTNNGPDSAQDVALGIKTIITDIQQRLPTTRILLLGIFPRNEHPDPVRAKNEEINKLISAYANPQNPKRVVYLDIGEKFLTPQQVLSKDIMPDLLHPNIKGYQIWAEAIIDTVKHLLQEDPVHLAPNFSPPSTVAKVAKIEEYIAVGNLVAGSKMLDKMTTDKDATVAAAAKASLETVNAWKASTDANIAQLRSDGDLTAAADLASGMAKVYAGDSGKAYRDQATEMRKDPAYAIGKEYQKLEMMPIEARKDQRFTKLVEAFLKKHQDGYYAQQAQTLIKK